MSQLTEGQDRLLKEIARASIRDRERRLQCMFLKIEGVITDLRAMRKEMPEAHWLKRRVLTNETLLRLALVDAEKAGCREPRE